MILRFLYPMSSISLSASIFMTVAVTVERYWAVCKPAVVYLTYPRLKWLFAHGSFIRASFRITETPVSCRPRVLVWLSTWYCHILISKSFRISKSFWISKSFRIFKRFSISKFWELDFVAQGSCPPRLSPTQLPKISRDRGHFWRKIPTGKNYYEMWQIVL